MANTPSANFSPTFMKAGLSTDQVDVTMGTVLPNALDTHDHTANHGLAVVRVASGLNASLPAAGSAGNVYVSTDTVTLHIDDGTKWHYGYTIISEITGDGAITSFDFTSIPAGFRTLELVIYGRTDNNATSDVGQLRFNNDSGANYNSEQLAALNVTASATTSIGATSIEGANFPAATATASYAAMSRIVIPNYNNATFFKAALANITSLTAAAGANQQTLQVAGIWLSTAAITRVTVAFTGHILAGSVASLYGL